VPAVFLQVLPILSRDSPMYHSEIAGFAKFSSVVGKRNGSFRPRFFVLVINIFRLRSDRIPSLKNCFFITRNTAKLCM